MGHSQSLELKQMKQLAKYVVAFMSLPAEELKQKPREAFEWLGGSIAALGWKLEQVFAKNPDMLAKIKTVQGYSAAFKSSKGDYIIKTDEKKQLEELLDTQKNPFMKDENLPKADAKLSKELNNILRQQRTFIR